jgi:hypothetical protein
MKPVTEAWAALAHRLGPEDRDSLARQGWISEQVRSSGARTFKLRWRVEGRQRVRYLGSDPAFAAHVRAILIDMQCARRTERQFAELLGQARRQLAHVKRQLAPELAARGYAYHGYTARRTRTSAPLER